QSLLIGPWDGLHSVPPHPGPLPRGEGEWSTAGRSHPCRSLPNNHRQNSNQKPNEFCFRCGGVPQGRSRYAVLPGTNIFLRLCGRKQSVLALELSNDKAVKSNRTLLISILLNFALLGWVISLLIMHHRETADSASGNDPVTTGAPAAHARPADHLAPQRLPQPRAERFDWRQVESEDYKEYIANL